MRVQLNVGPPAGCRLPSCAALALSGGIGDVNRMASLEIVSVFWISVRKSFGHDGLDRLDDHDVGLEAVHEVLSDKAPGVVDHDDRAEMALEQRKQSG